MELNRQSNNSNKFDFILNSISLSLGNQTTVKCLAHGIKFTKCWAKILDELVYSNENHNDPFIILLNKYFQSYHNTNICSSKTALVLTILLWKLYNQKLFINQAQSQQQRYDQVIHEIDKIFDTSIEKLKNNEIFITRIQSTLFEFRKSGRHQVKTISIQNEIYFKNLINRLCRSQLNHSDLIWNIFKYNSFKIDTNRTIFSFDDSQLEDFNDENWFFINSGILFEIDNQNRKSDLIMNSIIIDANLSHNYTHIGYNKDIKYNKIIKSNDFTSYSHQILNAKTEWLNKIKKVLIENTVNLLIVSGSVDQDLLNFCLEENIIVFTSLNAEKFKVIKNYFNNVTLLVYIEDFSQDCLFKCKLENSNYKNYFFAKKINEDENDIISVLIKKNRHMFLLKNQIKMFIEELKHNLKRFENVLNDKLFVENFDAILESNFAEIIYNVKNDSEDEINFSLAKEILYETFINYKNIVSSNVDKSDLGIIIYDDLKSKIESWRFALDINRMFLNIDFSLFCSLGQ